MAMHEAMHHCIATCVSCAAHELISHRIPANIEHNELTQSTMSLYGAMTYIDLSVTFMSQSDSNGVSMSFACELTC